MTAHSYSQKGWVEVASGTKKPWKWPSRCNYSPGQRLWDTSRSRSIYLLFAPLPLCNILHDCAASTFSSNILWWSLAEGAVFSVWEINDDRGKSLSSSTLHQDYRVLKGETFCGCRLYSYWPLLLLLVEYGARNYGCNPKITSPRRLSESSKERQTTLGQIHTLEDKKQTGAIREKQSNLRGHQIRHATRHHRVKGTEKRG